MAVISTIENQINHRITAQEAYNKFFNIAEHTGALKISKKVMGSKFVEDMKGFFTQEVDANITGGLMSLVVIAVVLLVMGIILGNLEQPLSAAIPDNSSFVGLKTSIPQNLTSAMSIAVIIPIIMSAVLILGVVFMLAARD